MVRRPAGNRSLIGTLKKYLLVWHFYVCKLAYLGHERLVQMSFILINLFNLIAIKIIFTMFR